MSYWDEIEAFLNGADWKSSTTNQNTAATPAPIPQPQQSTSFVPQDVVKKQWVSPEDINNTPAGGAPTFSPKDSMSPIDKYNEMVGLLNDIQKGKQDIETKKREQWLATPQGSKYSQGKELATSDAETIKQLNPLAALGMPMFVPEAPIKDMTQEQVKKASEDKSSGAEVSYLDKLAERGQIEQTERDINWKNTIGFLPPEVQDQIYDESARSKMQQRIDENLSPEQQAEMKSKFMKSNVVGDLSFPTTSEQLKNIPKNVGAQVVEGSKDIQRNFLKGLEAYAHSIGLKDSEKVLKSWADMGALEENQFIEGDSLASKVARTATNMAPQVILGMMGLGEMNDAQMFISILGPEYERNIQSGASPKRAMAAAVASSAMQTLMEKMSLGKVLSKGANVTGAGGFVKDLLKKGFQEGSMEGAQNPVSDISNIWAKSEGKTAGEIGKDILHDIPQMAKSALEAAKVGAIVGGGFAIPSTTEDYIKGKGEEAYDELKQLYKTHKAGQRIYSDKQQSVGREMIPISDRESRIFSAFDKLRPDQRLKLFASGDIPENIKRRYAEYEANNQTIAAGQQNELSTAGQIENKPVIEAGYDSSQTNVPPTPELGTVKQIEHKPDSTRLPEMFPKAFVPQPVHIPPDLRTQEPVAQSAPPPPQQKAIYGEPKGLAAPAGELGTIQQIEHKPVIEQGFEQRPGEPPPTINLPHQAPAAEPPVNVAPTDNTVIRQKRITAARNAFSRLAPEKQQEYYAKDIQTGLHTSRALSDVVDNGMADGKVPVAFEMEGLKLINDTEGHGGGDIALRVLGESMRRNGLTGFRTDKNYVALFDSKEAAENAMQAVQKTANELVGAKEGSQFLRYQVGEAFKKNDPNNAITNVGTELAKHITALRAKTDAEGNPIIPSMSGRGEKPLWYSGERFDSQGVKNRIGEFAPQNENEAKIELLTKQIFDDTIKLGKGQELADRTLFDHKLHRPGQETGILSKEGYTMLSERLEQQKAEDPSLTVAHGMADVRSLGKLNAEYGEKSGDTFLDALATLADKHGLTMGRMGGDEVGVVGGSKEEVAEKMAALQKDFGAQVFEFRSITDGKLYRVSGADLVLGVGETYNEAEIAANRAKEGKVHEFTREEIIREGGNEAGLDVRRHDEEVSGEGVQAGTSNILGGLGEGESGGGQSPQGSPPQDVPGQGILKEGETQPPPPAPVVETAPETEQPAAESAPAESLPGSPKAGKVFKAKSDEIASRKLSLKTAIDNAIKSKEANPLRVISPDGSVFSIPADQLPALRKKIVNSRVNDEGKALTQHLEKHGAREVQNEAKPILQPKSVPKHITKSFSHIGKKATISTKPNAPKVDTWFAVEEADDIISSHNYEGKKDPRYDDRDQQRSARENPLSVQQIRDQGEALDPEWLAGDATSQRGAPIVTPDKKVMSGNGRKASIDYAYKYGKADAYKQYLIANAKAMGLDPEKIRGMKKPVLVRVTDKDLPENFTRDSNVSINTPLSPADQARTDAEKLDSAFLRSVEYDADGFPSRASARKVIEQITPAQELPAQYDKNGNLTTAAEQRIQNAIFAKAFGADGRLVSKMAEEADTDIKTIIRSLNHVAGELAELRENPAAKKFDLSNHILDAVDLILEQKIYAKKGTSKTIDDYLAQGEMDFGQKKYSDNAIMLARLFDANKRKSKVLGDSLEDMVSSIKKTIEENEMGSLIPVEPRTINNIIEGAVNKEGISTKPAPQEAPQSTKETPAIEPPTQEAKTQPESKEAAPVKGGKGKAKTVSTTVKKEPSPTDKYKNDAVSRIEKMITEGRSGFVFKTETTLSGRKFEYSNQLGNLKDILKGLKKAKTPKEIDYVFDEFGEDVSEPGTMNAKGDVSPFPEKIADSWVDTTGDVVAGDTIRFKEGVFGGSFKNPSFLGDRTIVARVMKDSYGADKQQHTFSIEIIESSGYDPIKPETRTTRKGRNVYRNGTERLEWKNETDRNDATNEKHERGNIARANRNKRREENPQYSKGVTGSSTAADVESAIAPIRQRRHKDATPITVVQSAADLPLDIQKQLDITDRAAWIPGKDGKPAQIVMIADRIFDGNDAEQTLTEEIFHDGARQGSPLAAFGPNGREFLSGLGTYFRGSGKHRDAFVKLAKQYKLDINKRNDRIKAAEEYMFRVYQNPDIDRPLWKRVCDFVRKSLRSMGFNINPTDGEIRDMVQGAINKSDEAMIIGTTGGEVGLLAGKRKETRIPGFADVSAKDVDKYFAQEISGDRMAQVKHVVDLAVKNGVEVKPEENPHILETLAHGKKEERIRVFDRDLVKPLMKYMIDNKISLEDLGWFAAARHAATRNAIISVRTNPIIKSAQAKMESNDKEIKHIKKILTLTKDKKKIKQYNRELKKLKEENYNLGAQIQNANMTGGKNLSGSGISNDVAQGILDFYKNKGLTDKLDGAMPQVKKITDFKLDSQIADGLLDKATADGWRSTFGDTYIPLKGVTGANKFSRTGNNGFEVMGIGEYEAKGRHSLPENPIVHAIEDARDAIIRGENNIVSKSLARLVSKIQTTFEDEGLGQIRTAGWSQDIDPVTGEINMVPPGENKDNSLPFRMNGKQYFLEARNPVIEKGVRNLKQLDVFKFNKDVLEKLQQIPVVKQLIKLPQATVNLTRNTAVIYNPIFPIGNFIRDAGQATAYMAGEKGLKLATSAVKSLPAAYKAIQEYKTLDGNVSNATKKYTKMYKEYIDAGGKTAYYGKESDIEANTEDFNEIKDALEYAERTNGRPKLRQELKELAKWMEGENDTIENTTRFGVYIAMRESGKSATESANYAKNITVNFNRKGRYSAILSSLYVFANPSIQGSFRFAEALKSPGFRKLFLEFAAFGVLNGLANQALCGDDDDGENYYNSLPENIKKNYMIFMLPGFMGGKGQYIKVKMPYVMSMPLVIGELVSRLPSAIQNQTDEDWALNFMDAILSPFNFLGMDRSKTTGGTIAKLVAPTFLDPAVQYWLNENWYGGNIYKDDFAPSGGATSRDKGTEHEQYYSSANPTAIKLAEILAPDKAEPSWRDIHPETLEWLGSQFTGGVGRFMFQTMGLIDQTGETVKGLATGSDVPVPNIKDVPVLNQFFGSARNVPGKDEKAWRDIDKDISRLYDQVVESETKGQEDKRLESKKDVLALIPYNTQRAKEHYEKQLKDWREKHPGDTMDSYARNKIYEEARVKYGLTMEQVAAAREQMKQAVQANPNLNNKQKQSRINVINNERFPMPEMSLKSKEKQLKALKDNKKNMTPQQYEQEFKRISAPFAKQYREANKRFPAFQ